MELDFDKMGGLVPAIIQDAEAPQTRVHNSDSIPDNE